MSYCKEGSLYSIFGHVVKLHFHRMHETLDKVGIYPGQHPVLFHLLLKDGQSQKELAQKIKIQPATITVMLKRMEKAQIVERKVDTNDQRIIRVYLTEEGKRIAQEAKEIINEIGKECFANFTQEEEVILRRLLLQIKDNLLKVQDK